MSGESGLIVSEELKERIEHLAQEREESPSALIASALDMLLEAEALQVAEARRRLASRSGKAIPQARVSAWLDTWGLDKDASPPKCE